MSGDELPRICISLPKSVLHIVNLLVVESPSGYLHTFVSFTLEDKNCAICETHLLGHTSL